MISSTGFSILVGSSLWCNPDVSLQIARGGYQFQYPRRIEPLVQLEIAAATRSKTARFSILVGSSLWCNPPP